MYNSNIKETHRQDNINHLFLLDIVGIDDIGGDLNIASGKKAVIVKRYYS